MHSPGILDRTVMVFHAEGHAGEAMILHDSEGNQVIAIFRQNFRRVLVRSVAVQIHIIVTHRIAAETADTGRAAIDGVPGVLQFPRGPIPDDDVVGGKGVAAESHLLQSGG